MAESKKPFFIDDTDLDFFREITMEASDLFFREIEVHFLDRERTKYDPLYGESLNMVFVQPYRVRATVELTPKKAELIKAGLDEPRDFDEPALVSIDVGVLKRGSGPMADVGMEDPYATERGGFPAPEPGDQFMIEGEMYKILTQQNRDYFWHTEEHLTYMFSCERQRPRSIEDSVPVEPDVNPDGPRHTPSHAIESEFPGEDS